MNEQQTNKKYKTWLVIVSVLLIAVLCAQGIYMAGGFGRSDRKQTEAAEETVAADTPAAETPAETPAVETAAAEPQTGQAAPADTAGAASTVSTEAAAKAENALTAATEEVPGSLSHEGYTLEQVVVFSRHNIRSPLTGNGSILTTITPNQWTEWSSGVSELSLRGGDMETHMGQYFRKWLEAEGLFPVNYHPEEGEVRIFANSKQRTIATAQFFAAGLLPTAGIPVEYHGEFDSMQPEFFPKVNFMNDAYEEAVRKEATEIFEKKRDILAQGYEQLKRVLDFEQSEAYKSGTMTEFRLDDLKIEYVVGEEPKMTGTLKSACSASDALILQYYEEPDAQKAAFGKILTQEEWKQISAVKDIYNEVLFASPLFCGTSAHDTMETIRGELTGEGKKFSFLCGHDSNIMEIFSCLKVADFEIPASVETRTPIGGKIVFSRWRSAEGEELMSVDLVYATTAQLRDMTMLDLETHPAIVPVVLEGLAQNADGLYKYEDVLQRFDEAIGAYDRIVEEYGEEELDPAA